MPSHPVGPEVVSRGGIYGIASCIGSIPMIPSSLYQSHRCYPWPISQRVRFALLNPHSDPTLCSSFEPGAEAFEGTAMKSGLGTPQLCIISPCYQVQHGGYNELKEDNI